MIRGYLIEMNAQKVKHGRPFLKVHLTNNFIRKNDNENYNEEIADVCKKYKITNNEIQVRVKYLIDQLVNINQNRDYCRR